ncbi:Copper amine oxidase N-terminal domain-containing protein [Paenibacillaceae bacterium GAS479]|nr:Copper amine oxidase N-terminal domain-containing protein [Paenibacillaceae bacterium GAS479]
MKRMVIALSVLFILCIVQSSLVLAAAPPIKPIQIVANGEFIKIDIDPLSEQGHLFIPIRALASLGLSYSFNPASKMATVKNKNGDYIKLTESNKTALYNEKSIELSQPAQNKQGRFLVPIRLVSEILGYNVQYEEVRNFVFIDSKDFKSGTSIHNSINNEQDLYIARRAAISLPIVTNFKTLGRVGVTQQYSFPVGRADYYYYVDGPYTTFVEIKNGQAVALGQQQVQDRSPIKKTAGSLSPNVPLDEDPVMLPYRDGNVVFSSIGIGRATAAYDDDNNKRIERTNYMNTYWDVIQKIPK